MSDKTDERLDQHIRQALDALPDAPPPGSTFDAGRLWEQLRPELIDQPVGRPGKKPAYLWWVAAASLAGLLIGWVWQSLPDQWPKPRLGYEQSGSTQTREKKLAYERPVRTPTKERFGKAGFALSESQDLGKRGKKSLAGVNHKLKTEPVKPVNLLRAAQIRLLEAVPSASTALTLLAETTPDSPMPISLTHTVASRQPTTPAVSKRRFRVVHENELITEDEAYRIRHSTENRAEGLVRLGTGSQSLSTLDAGSPLLKLPLNRKSTQ